MNPTDTIERTVELLQLNGHDAHVNVDLGPTDIDIFLPGGSTVVHLARGFNVEGWEAVRDTDGDAEGLEDGPGRTASPADIVAWVREIL